MIKVHLEGQKFGRLQVIKRDGSQNGSKVYLCQCDCGNLTHQRSDHMRSGRSKSCGCLRNEESGNRARKHGKSKSQIYFRFQHMLARCYDPKCPEYKWYGGRGVTVCDRWNPARGGSFENFYADMGDPPTDKHQLDKDILGGDCYCPEKCLWVTPGQNARARRNVTNLTYQGKTQCLTDWASEYELKPATLSMRLKSGWSIERALTQPVRGAA